MPSARLSVCIITLNEEAVLPQCLESVSFADEIVVVDSGSRDKTLRIAGRAGAAVFQRPMEGFGAQKQFAVDHATGDWILSVDADEWVSPELRESLKEVLEAESKYDGYRMNRRNVYLGRAMRFCGWYQPILRLFRRGRGSFNQRLVHEGISVSGPVGTLVGDLMHVPYRDLSHHLEKMCRYVPLDARELDRSGRRVRGWLAPFQLLLRPCWKFFQKYILQQGYREGLHGLVLSGMASVGVFLIYAECWRIQAKRPTAPTESRGDGVAGAQGGEHPSGSE